VINKKTSGQNKEFSMPNEFNFTVRLYSPRWEHDDAYKLTFKKKQISILNVDRTFTCSLSDNGESEWLDTDSINRKRFESSLANDSIYPPTIFFDALQDAWMAWRDGRLDDQSVSDEVQVLCDWVNMVSCSKPSTSFWKSVF
jgi:hypothetical protein